jgi:protein-S-isoprenylcysteine O-methyltransferase Ste14
MITRTTKITIETEGMLAVRQGRTVVAWCPECQAEVEVMRSEDHLQMMRKSGRPPDESWQQPTAPLKGRAMTPAATAGAPSQILHQQGGNMGALDSVVSENHVPTSRSDFFTRPWVDKAFAIVACIPIAYPLIRYRHDLDLSITTVTWVLDIIVIVSTMFFRRTAVRVTRNPWLWLLTCLATYWFIAIGFLGEPGRTLASVWATNTFAIMSTVVELWGRFSLGRNIGLVPAQRRVVTRGAYRFMRHPIYTGIFIWIIGDLLAGYSPRNTLLSSLGILWFVIKSFVEEGFMKKDPSYAQYMERVRWRWFPGIA